MPLCSGSPNCVDLTGLANSIWINDLNSISSISTGYIYNWLLSDSNLGRLNNYIITSFYNNSGDISQNLTNQQADIYRGIYLVNYYTNAISLVLQGALSPSSFLKIVDHTSSIQLLDPTKAAQVYVQIKRDIQTQLDQLVFDYQRNNANPVTIDMGSPYEYAAWNFGGGNPRYGLGSSYLS